MTKQLLPYGLWPSPLTPTMLGERLRLEDVQFDSDGETLLWVESRSGHSVLVARRGNDAPRELSGGFTVGGGVGYGGGDFAVRNGLALFASGERLYRVSLGYGLPQVITPAFGEVASPVISPDGSQALFISSYERTDCLALVDTAGDNWPRKLAQGADFYMQPAWHPDGKRIAWVEWNHPQMPWDGTRLMSARIEAGALADVRRLYGDVDVPVFQPEFSPDGRFLAFLATDGEWDTLYALDLTSGERRILAQDASLLEPAWAQGMRVMAWSGDSSRVFYLRNDKGWRTLWASQVASGESEQINVAPYTWIMQLAVAGERVAFIGSSPKIPERVVSLQGGALRVECRSDPESISPADLPTPQPIEWPAPDGTAVHGLFYPPTSSRFDSDEALPPVILDIHGGPTSQRNANYNRDAAFFATRGYGFLELNYRGSSGYGRKYMLMLRAHWGQVDVEDTVAAVQALKELGLADARRAVVMGGSAGGYTVLNCLIRHPGVFKAGVNLFGVSNLFDVLVGTHKFEEHYNDSLVGALPQDAERLKAWSPVFHAEQIKDPIAIFQGTNDKVVPPEHSERIAATLRANKVPHIYCLYEGEGHGWRKSETIIDYYETVDLFLKQHVLF